VIGVPATTALHPNKAERFRLTDGWRNSVMVYAVVNEVLLRDRQIAVVAAAVLGVLDFNPRNDAVSGQAQHPVCR
jgi:hypothetical protein